MKCQNIKICDGYRTESPTCRHELEAREYCGTRKERLRQIYEKNQESQQNMKLKMLEKIL